MNYTRGVPFFRGIKFDAIIQRINCALRLNSNANEMYYRVIFERSFIDKKNFFLDCVNVNNNMANPIAQSSVSNEGTDRQRFEEREILKEGQEYRA